jgi:hypothetical protein
MLILNRFRAHSFGISMWSVSPGLHFLRVYLLLYVQLSEYVPSFFGESTFGRAGFVTWSGTVCPFLFINLQELRLY